MTAAKKLYVDVPEDESASGSASLLDDVLNRTIKREPTSGALPNVMLGKIADVSNRGLFISLPMIFAEPALAASVCAVSREQIGQTCAVQFIDNDFSKPIVMGLLIGQQATILPDAKAESLSPQLAVSENENTLKIEAKQQLILQCGAARIVMNADGIIRIRGLYIDSQARATQRIRGGSVRVN